MGVVIYFIIGYLCAIGCLMAWKKFYPEQYENAFELDETSKYILLGAITCLWVIIIPFGLLVFTVWFCSTKTIEKLGL